MNNRFPDWPERAAREMSAARGRAWQWGAHDCCQFAGRVVEATTGANPMQHIPFYNSREGMAAAIRGFASGGLRGCAEKMAHLEGWRSVLPTMPPRGSVALLNVGTGGVPGAGSYSVGITWGRFVAVADRVGVGFVSPSLIVAAWVP